ncbi:hypothetical protein [Sphingomonas faeni]|uniref:hypothetical protein n=1 Tax=Sphingomonas faeni TaxID=185950 RepID=UPI0020BF8DE5|nr:hypothetical protein [Sphingomonas faeni]MCK8457034.1 hypothetical protein [Sphingomonas faeni]
MPKPTDERIGAALAQGARLTDVNILIADMQAEIAEATAEAARLDAVSIAVETAEADADDAADEAAKQRRRATRMTAKLELLHARVTELEDSNRRKLAETAYAGAMQRRDDLAADIRKQWPELTASMIALFTRIQESDAECRKLGSCYGKPALISAEAVARGCSNIFVVPVGGCGGQHVPRLTDTRLTCLEASDSFAVTYGIWPPRDMMHG